MAQKTDEQLIIEANIIKDETIQGANTANRVGNMLLDIVDSKINNESGSTQTLDQVLAEGNTAYDKQLHIADVADPTQAENIIEYNSMYMYDQNGFEAAYVLYEFWIYQYFNTYEFYVAGYLGSQDPYLDIFKGDSNSRARLYAQTLQFKHFLDSDYNTINLYSDQSKEGIFDVTIASESGTIKLVDTVTTIDTKNNGDYFILKNGAYEIILTDPISSVIFPNPVNFEGKTITIVNTDGTNCVISVDANAPYWNGSSTQINSIGANQMMIFTAINGKWRGGLIYD